VELAHLEAFKNTTMTAMQKVTGADWAAWGRHLLAAIISSGATSVEAAMCAGAGAQLASEQWQPQATDWSLLAYAALAGLVLGVARYLKTNPLPTGSEVEES